MDVGIVSTAGGVGGLVRYCTGLAGALVRAGHRVTLYSPDPPPGPYESVRLPAGPWRGGLRLRGLAREHDVLHLQPLDGAPLALLATRPFVATANGDDVITDDRVDRFLKRRALARAKLVLPNSSFTSRLVAERFPDVATPREVVAPLVEPAPEPDFTAANELGVDEFVLSVGNLVPRKGFDALARAGAAAGVAVVVVGAGPDEARLRAVAKEAGADLRLLGRRSDEEVEGLYRRARLVGLMSRAEDGGRTVEGFGMTLVEAMRHTVAFCTPHGGMVDVLPPELQVADEHAAAALIEYLLEDSHAYAELRRRCRERYERLFSEAALLPRFVAAYERAIRADA